MGIDLGMIPRGLDIVNTCFPRECLQELFVKASILFLYNLCI